MKTRYWIEYPAEVIKHIRVYLSCIVAVFCSHPCQCSSSFIQCTTYWRCQSSEYLRICKGFTISSWQFANSFSVHPSVQGKKKHKCVNCNYISKHYSLRQNGIISICKADNFNFVTNVKRPLHNTYVLVFSSWQCT